MSARLKILYYSDAEGTGGAEAYLRSIARAAARAGYAVEAALTDAPAVDAFAAALDADGIRAHRLPVIRTLRRPGPWLRQFWFFVLHRYALIHFNQIDPWSCAPAILAARFAGLGKLISTTHLPNTVYDVPTPFRARVAPHCLARRILVGRCHLGEAGNGGGRPAPAARDRAVVNGIPLPDAVTAEARANARSELGLPLDALVVGTVGRMTVQKDHATLVQALARVPDAVGCLIGDGPERAALEAEAERRGVTDRVHFAGPRPGAVRLLPAFDVFALPSRYEGLPLALLEAMGAGLPVVASDLPETREVVRPETDGLLVPAGEETALAAALTRMLADADLRAACGRSGRERVAGDFSERRMHEETLSIYRDVLGERHR